MSAGEAGSAIVRLRSRFATAAPGTAPLDAERTETRVQRGIGLCAQLAGACDHTVASQPVVTRLLYCVHDILSKSTPAYPGPACSAEVAMQQVDLDHDGAQRDGARPCPAELRPGRLLRPRPPRLHRLLSGRARRAAAAAHAPCLGRCRTFLVPLYGIQFIRMESMQRTPPGAWRLA